MRIQGEPNFHERFRCENESSLERPSGIQGSEPTSRKRWSRRVRSDRRRVHTFSPCNESVVPFSYVGTCDVVTYSYVEARDSTPPSAPRRLTVGTSAIPVLRGVVDRVPRNSSDNPKNKASANIMKVAKCLQIGLHSDCSPGGSALEYLATNALSDEAFCALPEALSCVRDGEDFKLDLVVIAPP